MRFCKNVKRETREFLMQELKEYERETEMTKEERRLLHQWVASGRSPYDNGDYIYGAGGPLDFISALRTAQELQDWFDSLSEEEKQAEINGEYLQYNTETEDYVFDIASFILPDTTDDELPFQ